MDVWTDKICRREASRESLIRTEESDDLLATPHLAPPLPLEVYAYYHGISSSPPMEMMHVEILLFHIYFLRDILHFISRFFLRMKLWLNFLRCSHLAKSSTWAEFKYAIVVSHIKQRKDVRKEIVQILWPLCPMSPAWFKGYIYTNPMQLFDFC
jgi:hypothetical protein